MTAEGRRYDRIGVGYVRRRREDPRARAATSGFARQPHGVVDRVVAALAADLGSGRWDERHGHLRELEEYDAGLRLVIGRGT